MELDCGEETRSDDEGYAAHDYIKGYDSNEPLSKKRARTEQCDDNDEIQEVFPDTQCQQSEDIKPLVPVKDEPMDIDMPKLKPHALSPPLLATKGRPKAGNYELATRQILLTAIEIYCAILLTEIPFPTSSQEIDWAKGAWQMACQHHSSNIDHDATLLKLVCSPDVFFQTLIYVDRSWHEPATYVVSSSPRLGLL